MFDYIVIGLYILAINSGWKKGALKIIYNFIAIFIAIFIAKGLYPVVKVFFDNIGITNSINTWFSNIINIDVSDTLTIYDKIAFIEELNLPSSIVNYLVENNNIGVYTKLGVERFEDYIVVVMTYFTINIISALTVFILTYSILMILGVVLNIVTKIPIINDTNRVVGSFLEVILFTIYLFIFNLFLFITIPFSGLDMIRDFVEGSFFGNFEYVNNTILSFLLSYF